VPPEAAVDNDILIKLACYDLLAELMATMGGADTIAVLGVARFVVPNHIQKSRTIVNRPEAEGRFTSFLANAIQVEPTADEVALATALEEAAIADDASLDVGESQLCAIVATRLIPLLLTGDKRAIVAMEVIMPDRPELAVLTHRITCLEQVMLGFARRIDPQSMRSAVCLERWVDTAIAICFACHTEILSFEPGGLLSYISHLRDNAPTMLCEFEALGG